MSGEKKYSHLRLSGLSDEQRYRSFATWPGAIAFTDNDIIEGSYHLVASWVTSLPRPVHGPHSHNDDQLLIFLSSNPENIHDLGCDVEMYIGQDMERHVFSESNLVYIPAGLIHGPIRFRNLRRPFIFMQDLTAPKLTETPHKELVPDYERNKMVFFDFNGSQSEADVTAQYEKLRVVTDELKNDPVEPAPFLPMEPGEKKYSKYFFCELSPEKKAYKFGRLPQTIVFVDDDVIKGCHQFWALMISPGPWPEHGPHNHQNPEVMGTLGVDWNNPQDSGAEGGQDWMGTEMEHYTSNNTSNFTFMPAGVVHGPVRYGRRYRPAIQFQCHYGPKLTEKSFKHLVPKEKDTLVFFDLNGMEDEAAIDRQREARKQKTEDSKE